MGATTTQQIFDSVVLSDTVMTEVAKPSDTRRGIMLQNQEATAIIYYANTEHANGRARWRLLPGEWIGRDVLVPGNPIYAISDTAGAELTKVEEF